MLETIKNLNGYVDHIDGRKTLTVEFTSKSAAKKAAKFIEENDQELFNNVDFKFNKVYCNKDIVYEVDESQFDRTFSDSDYTSYPGFLNEEVNRSGELILNFDSNKTAADSINPLTAIGFNPVQKDTQVIC
jgi:hypothetical protein